MRPLLNWFHIYLIGWDSFIHSSIQIWEYFYIQWIRHGKNTLVVFYDSLASDSFEDTLKTITKFLNFQWSKHRLGCILKYDNHPFQTNDTCLPKGHLDITSKHVNSYLTNCKTSREKCQFHIYTKKHIIWINSAIRNVQREIRDHGIDASLMSNYKDKNISLSICTEN